MKKDKIFSKELKKIKEFEFNDDVADVFDDMVARSVPFYNEIHKIILDIASKYFVDGETIYDLGCSTGTTIVLLYHHLKEKNPTFIGIDNSSSMIKKCEEKLVSNKISNYKIICDDLMNIEFQKSQIVIMNYTLQFIEIEKRQELLKRVYDSLNYGGVFIFAEKIKCENEILGNLFIDLYYDFKRRNGYSELEISQKREALENFLVPMTSNQELDLLRSAGFKKVDMMFKWYNFASFIGIK